MRKKSKRSTAGIGILVFVLILCELASTTVLFSRMLSYTRAKFVNVMPLIDENGANSVPAASDPDSSRPASSASAPQQSETYTGNHHPEFRMEAEAEIFRFSYDETGKITVIGAEGNPDKLIAPGTGNRYQFTLRNPGDVPLDYRLTIEAYVTGTDLWIPVEVRVWDYTNHYLLGSESSMVDVMELNKIDESAELGAGRYAVYNLEWQWPFERADENGDITQNDIYDTMLGNLAVDEDLVLHIVIRTVAEYDDDPDDPNHGLVDPPQTGDDAPYALLTVLAVASFIGLCAMFAAYFVSGRKDKRTKAT